MKTKITYSSQKINPFSGIFFAIKSIKKKKIAKLILRHLGKRVKQTKYSYSDIILNWIFCNLCGAQRIEDSVKMKYYLDNIPEIRMPSPDMILRIFRKLSTKTETFNTQRATHQFNINLTMNKLMLSISDKLNLIRGDTLDYDNVILECEKYDSNRTYKDGEKYKVKGYQPGVGFIGKVPVYIEGRNGNSSAMHKMDETIGRAFEILKEKNIRIKRFRSDAAAYQEKIIVMMEKKGIEYFIRCRNSKALISEAEIPCLKWDEIFIREQKLESTSLEYYPFNRKENPCRVVVVRSLNEGGYNYRGIATNNRSLTDQQVINFYNQRGAIERNFDMLGNDFNWKRLPFSFLNENTVFMIIEAIGSIIYQYLIRNFSNKIDFVGRRFRLKRFIFQFIMVSGEWVNHNIKLFTNRDYTPLLE
ncbi:MAG: hypothetical protein COA65_08640 [Rhodospirillaceae bacterium]|nr:MAG: hypothetical protein COA65_08640 [Rhodospirillaceae bacterium]